MQNFEPKSSSASREGGGGMVSPIPCRLCEANCTKAFVLLLIEKYEVNFYCCSTCGSLQSEKPYWLADAYANSNLARIDTGAAQRNLSNLAAVYAWAHLSGARTTFDFGGGDGLLCRLLRDYGIDARMQDRYAVGGYAQAAPDGQPASPVLYTAFEVLEHFSNPKTDLEALFASRPESVLVTTAFFEGQGPDWWYLAPASGQHVFFYTKNAMQLIGRRFGYSVRFLGNYTLFDSRKRGLLTRALSKLMLSPAGLRIIRSLLMLFPAKGAIRDFERLTDSRAP